MPAPPHPSSDKEGSGITARKHLQPFEVLILIFVLDLQVDGRFPHRKDYTTLLSTMFVLRPLSYILLGAMLAWASPGLIPGSPRSVNKGGIRDRDFFNAELANNATMETRGLGINCRGSIGCSVACPPIWMMIWLFDAWVGDDQHYDNGKWIGMHSLHRAINSFLTLRMSLKVVSTPFAPSCKIQTERTVNKSRC